MEGYKIFTLSLMCLSVAVLISAGIIFLIRRYGKNATNNSKKSMVSVMLAFSGFLICSVWCLRYAVGYYAIVSSNGTQSLSCAEEVLNSLNHTLQTFSMDEEYTKYIQDGKNAIRAILGQETVWDDFYGIYASILNFVAPIAGGTILFDILASIFPKIKLHLMNLSGKRVKCYFSELNEASLALAKGMRNSNDVALRNACFIFTDAYLGERDEKGSEMLLEAKSMGAICTKDDLSHVKMSKRGSKMFFLIDEDQAGNLQSLANLADKNSGVYLKKSEIYFFTGDDAYVQVEKRVHSILKNEFHFTDSEMPTFVPVQNYRHLISNLLVSLPLYEPLLCKEPDSNGEKDLTVTILGTGFIGTEMFLSTYWFGQILNCNLKIKVVSQETEEEFWSKIDYINPEIRHTVAEPGKETDKNKDLLTIYREKGSENKGAGEQAKEYCTVTYFQCDIKSSKFISLLSDRTDNILDTDYFLVSLGSDETNISVANTIRRYIGQHHIKAKAEAKAGANSKTIIAYVVYNTELSKVLNGKRYYGYSKDSNDVYMKAIGCLEDVYSVKNIFMTQHNQFAMNIHENYIAMQSRSERAEAHNARMNNDYKYWATRSRAMHMQYKMYSMGIIKKSLFDFPDKKEEYFAMVKAAHDEYKRIATTERSFDTPEQREEYMKLLHKMAWLEHRRWNAFTRVMGFRSTGDYKVYADVETKTYKQMELKLHPCLVECDQNGIKANISTAGIVSASTLMEQKNNPNIRFDVLDDLSYELQKGKYIDFDFKENDYPYYDFKDTAAQEVSEKAE